MAFTVLRSIKPASATEAYGLITAHFGHNDTRTVRFSENFLNQAQVIWMNRAGVPVTIETTAEKHGGNANMFTWRWGKVFAQGPRDTAAVVRTHFYTCDTLRTGSACARITLQTIEKQNITKITFIKTTSKD